MSITQVYQGAALGRAKPNPMPDNDDPLLAFADGNFEAGLRALENFSDQELVELGLPKEMLLQIRPALETIFKTADKLVVSNDQFEIDKRRNYEDKIKNEQIERQEAAERWNNTETELGGLKMTNARVLEIEKNDVRNFDNIWSRLANEGRVKEADKETTREAFKLDIKRREDEKAGKKSQSISPASTFLIDKFEIANQNSLVMGATSLSQAINNNAKSSDIITNGSLGSGYEIFNVEGPKQAFNILASSTTQHSAQQKSLVVKPLEKIVMVSNQKMDAF